MLNGMTFDVPAPRPYSCDECDDARCIGHTWLVPTTGDLS